MRPRVWLRLSLLAGLAAALLAAPAVAQVPDRPADARLTVEVADVGSVPRDGDGTLPVNVTYWSEEGGAAERVEVQLVVHIPVADGTVDARLERQVVTFRPDPTGGSSQRTVDLSLATEEDAPDRVAIEVTAVAEDAPGTVRRPDNASWIGLVDIQGIGPQPAGGTGAPAAGSTGSTGPVAPWQALQGPWWVTSSVAVTGSTIALAVVAVAARPADPRLLAGAIPVAAVTLATSWVAYGGVQVRVGVAAVAGAVVGLAGLHLGQDWDGAIGATFFASFVGVIVGSDLAAIVLGQIPPDQSLVIGGAGVADALVLAPLLALLYLAFSVATMAAVDRIFPGQGWLIDPPDRRPLGGPKQG